MKAACLLLCVALARQSAGHIFRRQPTPQMDNLIVQPLDYIDQPLYQEQNPQEYQQGEQYRPYQSSQVQENHRQDQPRSSEEQNPIFYYHPHHHHQHKHQRPKYQKEYRSEQQPQHEEYQQHKKVQDRQTSESTSAESNSQETRNRIEEYAVPQFADIEMNTHALSDKKMRIQPAFGDVIAWKGVQIANGPNYPVRKEDIEKIFDDAYKTMKPVSEENKKIFHEALVAATNTDNEDAHLNATQLLNKYQYEVEEHTIKTDDGYYLTLFRIPQKEQTLVPKAVVFLMHGLLGSADDWLLMGPGKSLAYLLADAGYEVWLGNARGSKYSRRHVSKHPARDDFWQFGTDEIALYDLPAMIDYVLHNSNQEKLYYVGYSQGTTAYFALASARPEYNDKIIMMYALSPMVYMANVRSPMLRMISPKSQFYSRLHEQLGHGEFMPTKELVNTVGGSMCESEIGCKNVCSNVNFVMSGFNVEQMDADLINVIMGHLPAGASTRQIKQYAQAVASQEFTRYDYGPEMNEKVYGERQPLKYDMQKVNSPVVLYYTEADWLAHPKDVERLAKELPNVTETYKVPEPFGSMHFQFSKKAPEVVYKRLIESLLKQNENYVY